VVSGLIFCKVRKKVTTDETWLVCVSAISEEVRIGTSTSRFGQNSTRLDRLRLKSNNKPSVSIVAEVFVCKKLE
jgi:hypothetical protein